MTQELADKVKKFIHRDDVFPYEKFKVVFHGGNYVVLRNLDNNLLTYVVNGHIYKEEIPVYPVFSLEEIKEALLM